MVTRRWLTLEDWIKLPSKFEKGNMGYDITKGQNEVEPNGH